MSGRDFAPQDACDCCEGVTVQSPVAPDNRPGLSAVAYRIGRHSEILASLQARLSSTDYPALANLRTRDSDDFSIALLNAFASMADVLTFYQERIANESYLRTATERLSLQELARLIGYSLRPGLAAETYLAFTLEKPPKLPEGIEPQEPKQYSGVPESVTLEAGIQVKSIPGRDEKPQTFETVEPIEARPEWNALRPRLTKKWLPKQGSTNCYFKRVDLNLKPGDGLLFLAKDDNDDVVWWQFRRIATVDPSDTTNKRTYVTWSGELDSSPLNDQEPQAFVLRKQAAVYGHNAPMWKTLPGAFKEMYPPDAPAPDNPNWPNFKISEVPIAVDLDSRYPDIINESWLVLTAKLASGPELIVRMRRPSSGESAPGLSAEEAKPDRLPSDATGVVRGQESLTPGLFRVAVTSEVSLDTFAMSAKVTRVSLDKDFNRGAGWSDFEEHVRETAVYAVSEELTLVEAPDKSSIGGNSLELKNKVDELVRGRKVILAGRLAKDDGKEQAEVLTIGSVETDGDRTSLVFTEDLGADYERESVTIYANVARATHGETVHQILGSGNGRAAHQRFALQHAPLTFVGADNELGAEASLKVTVNDIKWHQEPSLYGINPNDRSYVIRVDEDGKGQIQFGDGKRGAQLPTGRDNVRAEYRKGIGASGNLKAGQLSQLLTRPLGLKAVSNPLPTSGGMDADSAKHARRNMPLGVRTLGRVVSLRDYEDFARAYTGIAKAQAIVINTVVGRTMFITVAGEGGTIPEQKPTLDNLVNALHTNGDPFVHFKVEGYSPAYFTLSLQVKADPDYDADKVCTRVAEALRKAFSFDARDFGQPVARSEVYQVAQQVDGVVAIKLGNFYIDRTPNQIEEHQIEEPDDRGRLFPHEAARRQGAELLLIDPGELTVEPMP